MDHTLHAQLSDAAYGSARAPEGWEIDDELSSRNRTLFYHPESKRAVMSFRGTRINNVHDLTTDTMLAMGLQNISARFRNALSTTKAAMYKYPNLEVTGHSLAGSQALYVNSKIPDVKAVAFAPYVNPTTELRRRINEGIGQLFGNKRPSINSYVHITKPDLVSTFAWLSKAKHIQHPVKKGISPHSIRQFYP
jgi:hypothetical protein